MESLPFLLSGDERGMNIESIHGFKIRNRNSYFRQVGDSKPIYFQNLDVVRFLAAFSIVISHGFEAWKTYYIDFVEGEGSADAVFASGWRECVNIFMYNLNIGVDVFFVISGFLITYLLVLERKRNERISLPKFYMRRSLRIWPLYFLLIAIAPLIVSWVNYPEPDYLPHILFVGNFHQYIIDTFQFPFSHFWSIAIEEQFYLVWPLILICIKPEYLKRVFFLLILSSILVRIYFWMEGVSHMQQYLHTLTRMDALVIGGLAALYFAEGRLKFRKVNVWIRWALFAGVMAGLSFVVYASYDSFFNAAFKKYVFLLPVVWLLGYYVLATDGEEPGFFKRIFSYLGKISYGVYMFHNFVVVIVIKKILLNNDLKSGWLFALVYGIVSIVIPILSFEGFEKWFLKLKERFAVILSRKY